MAGVHNGIPSSSSAQRGQAECGSDEFSTGVNPNINFRSYTILVIKAHQQSTLKMSMRSNSDFWKDIHSSAGVDSPKVCKIDIPGHLPP
jgi:hypothetical protein